MASASPNPWKSRVLWHGSATLASSFRRWELIQRPTIGQCEESEKLWNSQSYRICLHRTSPLGDQGATWKRRQKDGILQGNHVFQTQQDQCTRELTETAGGCTGVAQVQARRGPSDEREEWTEAPIHNQGAISS